MKIIVSEGKVSKTIEVPKEKEVFLYGMKIGHVFEGSIIGIPKKLKIIGGSDKDGFPMRADIEGARKVKILIRDGPGAKAHRGRRKTVRGNMIDDSISQLNVIVVEEEIEKGSAESKKEKEKKEERKEEKKEEKAEEQKEKREENEKKKEKEK
jgi:small subunit ribosomal protein S6e